MTDTKDERQAQPQQVQPHDMRALVKQIDAKVDEVCADPNRCDGYALDRAGAQRAINSLIGYLSSAKGMLIGGAQRIAELEAELRLRDDVPEGHGWLPQSEWQRLLDVQKRRVAELQRERDALVAGLDRDTRSRYALIDRVHALKRALRKNDEWQREHGPSYHNSALEIETRAALTDQPADAGEPSCCARTREQERERLVAKIKKERRTRVVGPQNCTPNQRHWWLKGRYDAIKGCEAAIRRTGNTGGRDE
jgi:hypothetical protein